MWEVSNSTDFMFISLSFYVNRFKDSQTDTFLTSALLCFHSLSIRWCHSYKHLTLGDKRKFVVTLIWPEVLWFSKTRARSRSLSPVQTVLHTHIHAHIHKQSCAGLTVYFCQAVELMLKKKKKTHVDLSTSELQYNQQSLPIHSCCVYHLKEKKKTRLNERVKTQSQRCSWHELRLIQVNCAPFDIEMTTKKWSNLPEFSLYSIYTTVQKFGGRYPKKFLMFTNFIK